MKALSVHPAYAMKIVGGQKTIECRSWKTDYRGDIVICSTAKKFAGTIPGHAIGVVELADIRPFTRADLDAALMLKKEYQEKMYAWILKNPRFIVPFAVKGKLSLWNCDHDIEIIPEPKTEEEDKANFDKYWRDLIIPPFYE